MTATNNNRPAPNHAGQLKRTQRMVEGARESALQLVEEAHEERQLAVRQALADGVPRTRIAQELGLSAQTVGEILKWEPRKTP